MAFFPCIYFNQSSQLAMTPEHMNYVHLNTKETMDAIIERSRNRQFFYEKIIRLFAICKMRGLRMIVENPASLPHFLLFTQNFIMKPALIDRNRRLRGDYYTKPTAYWFVECSPTSGESYQTPKMLKNIEAGRPGIRGGICSEERSMISPDYARNFICDFIIGKQQPDICPTLF